MPTMTRPKGIEYLSRTLQSIQREIGGMGLCAAVTVYNMRPEHHVPNIPKDLDKVKVTVTNIPFTVILG